MKLCVIAGDEAWTPQCRGQGRTVSSWACPLQSWAWLVHNGYHTLGLGCIRQSCTGCVLPKTTSLRRKRATKSQHSLSLPKSCTHPGEGMAPLKCKTAPGTWCELSFLILSTTLKGRCGPLKVLTETPVSSPWRSHVPGEGRVLLWVRD